MSAAAYRSPSSSSALDEFHAEFYADLSAQELQKNLNPTPVIRRRLNDSHQTGKWSTGDLDLLTTRQLRLSSDYPFFIRSLLKELNNALVDWDRFSTEAHNLFDPRSPHNTVTFSFHVNANK